MSRSQLLCQPNKGVVKLFYESDTVPIVIIANGYYDTAMKCTHYSGTRMIVHEDEKVPGFNTPHDDLVPVESHKCK